MKPGSLVECINDSYETERVHHIPNRPTRGKHYFIRDIGTYKGKIGIRLEEIANPPMNAEGFEPTFSIERFREIEGLDNAIEEMLEETVYV